MPEVHKQPTLATVVVASALGKINSLHVEPSHRTLTVSMPSESCSDEKRFCEYLSLAPFGCELFFHLHHFIL